jgi:hypothetical protein
MDDKVQSRKLSECVHSFPLKLQPVGVSDVFTIAPRAEAGVVAEIGVEAEQGEAVRVIVIGIPS